MKFCDLGKQLSPIRDKIDNRIKNVLDHGQFILGPEVQEVEERLSEFSKVKFCLTVKNGTDALMIALRALDIKTGDEVIVPAFTFFATAEMVSLIGATPVFVDVSFDDFNISPKEIEKAITPKTKAIIAVDLYGQCANYSAIEEIATRNSLKLVTDAAQSYGATHKNKSVGNFGDITCTSFFPAKPLGVYGDGGAVFTNNAEYFEKLKLLRNHGQKKRYLHHEIGHNARMDTMQCAILLEKLAIFPKEIELRNEIAQLYTRTIKGHGLDIILPEVREGNMSVWAQYTIRLKGRDTVREKMQEAGIPTAIHYPLVLNEQPVYKGVSANVPISKDLAASVLSLPFHPYLEQTEVENVVKELSRCVKP